MTDNSLYPLPDGVYRAGSVQVKYGDTGSPKLLSSNISPYQPAHPTFQLINNIAWRVDMVVPEGHDVIMRSYPSESTGVGNSYNHAQLHIISTNGVIDITISNGTYQSVSSYQVPVYPYIGVTTLPTQGYTVHVASDNSNRYSLDGGITWNVHEGSFNVPDGNYSAGSILVRDIIINDLYEAYGPIIGLDAIISPYLITNGVATYSPGAANYIVTGVGPVGSVVEYESQSVTITNPSGQFELDIPVVDGIQEIVLTLRSDELEISSPNVIPIRTIYQGASQLVMGYSWRSITVPSSNASNPSLTIINLEAGQTYQLTAIRSYAGMSTSGTPTVVNLTEVEVTADDNGRVKYSTSPDYDAGVHPYIQLLIGAGIIDGDNMYGPISDGIVTFEVVLERNNSIIIPSAHIAYYSME